MTQTSRSGLGWLVLAAVCWGTSGTLGVGLREASGLGLLAAGGYRLLVGGLLMAGFALARNRLRLPRTAVGWRRIAALGLATSVFQAAFFSSIGFVGVAVATLVTIGSSPAMVLAVEASTGRQRLTGRLGLALAAAMAGLALLAGSPPAGLAVQDAVIGTALALTAGAAFATISLLGANPVEDFDHTTGTGLAFLGGGVLVLTGAAVTDHIAFTPSLASVALLIAMGLIPSAVAYLAYFHGLRTQTGTVGAVVSLLEPTTATILAAVVLGERLMLPALGGAVLLVTAVLLTALPARATTA
ncbi:MAG: DMT family transporter [Propioniciclava sp.]|uniref:DMT family transporter n=1 Tax=Propioniciclava sp. TaxID=2038686 RepID=UPI0039E49668